MKSPNSPLRSLSPILVIRFPFIHHNITMKNHLNPSYITIKIPSTSPSKPWNPWRNSPMWSQPQLWPPALVDFALPQRWRSAVTAKICQAGWRGADFMGVTGDLMEFHRGFIWFHGILWKFDWNWCGMLWDLMGDWPYGDFIVISWAFPCTLLGFYGISCVF